jgi:hypothetical protein
LKKKLGSAIKFENFVSSGQRLCFQKLIFPHIMHHTAYQNKIPSENFNKAGFLKKTSFGVSCMLVLAS